MQAGRGAVQFVEEDRRCVVIGQNEDLPPGSGQGDVEDAALALLVGTQPVGEEPT